MSNEVLVLVKPWVVVQKQLHGANSGTKIVCNSWYWLTDAMGKTFKVCSLNYNCPNNGDCICGMRDTSEESINNQGKR